MTETPVRTTRQRRAVAAVMADLDGFASAREIHDALRDRGESVGLSTVYRNLQALVDAEEVDQLRSDDGEVLYRRCMTDHHHHHLVCRECNRTVEVQGPALERWVEQVGAENGFRQMSHTLEIFGTCDQCA
ncbi:transcriptional repressor [Mumia sp. zg.B53]|uniref:Fur family transcriptional regulator n=1 Tax=unclassified Mumia TaxID=2621872 RepID=UPI001C6F1317|nr:MULTISPECIES: transcriptional repressor [unclassified Mumia]MBW9205622.1 transcriptional repressor [Mumia sp. zg.B17]MBW9208376.1 transcriptional repressor [Mumia sp. zg.B21]MBW9216334.1 transcriptional repressor [Mumia sp. zg.B53]MDD9347980.1 transcriptional repressor [Mumia sp.]